MVGMTADSNLAEGKEPRFIRLRLDQIHVPRSAFRWIDDAGFYPMSVPSVTQQALPILQFIQPILVSSGHNYPSRESSKKNSYTLVAGRRTFQLLLEHFTRKSKIWVIHIGLDESETNSWEAMDILSSMLLRRPDDETKTLIAAALYKDDDFSASSGNFVDVSNTHKISSLLGMSRATFNRAIKSVDEMALKKLKTAAEAKTTLGIVDDDLVDE